MEFILITIVLFIGTLNLVTGTRLCLSLCCLGIYVGLFHSTVKSKYTMDSMILRTSGSSIQPSRPQAFALWGFGLGPTISQLCLYFSTQPSPALSSHPSSKLECLPLPPFPKTFTSAEIGQNGAPAICCHRDWKQLHASMVYLWEGANVLDGTFATSQASARDMLQLSTISVLWTKSWG